MATDGATDDNRTASSLHRFSEHSSAQQVVSSWSLIGELEQLPSLGNGIAETAAETLLPPATAAAPMSPREPAVVTQAAIDQAATSPGPAYSAHDTSSPPPNLAPPPVHPEAEAQPFGQLFSGYGTPRQPAHHTAETPLKPLLQAIAQQAIE